MVFTLMAQSVVYAGTSWENKGREISDIQKFSDGTMSRVIGTPRGNLISSFEVAISDRGKGTAGIYGIILCHEAMSEIRMNLYLDIWEPERNDWKQIKSYKFIWDESNTPEGKRNAGMVDIKVSGLERGRDYRVRGVAGARALNSSLQESWSADSGDIQIQSLD